MRKKDALLSGDKSQPGTDKGRLCAPQMKRVPSSNMVGEPEGQKQAVERIAAVERTDQHTLDHEADAGSQERRDDERAPEADIGDERVGEVAADRQETAMREIDDPAERLRISDRPSAISA